jgi:UDP-N-acetylglucosamine transferase subunit ALG13
VTQTDMIFATVGTQLPFDRLILALDDWAAQNPQFDTLAQTGRTAQRFGHLRSVESMDQSEFARAFAQARVIVAHAGMGTILSATEIGKPILLLPRRAAFGEHRNDHQIDTAAKMAALPNVTVLQDAGELAGTLTRLLASSQDVAAGSAQASPALIANLRRFIFAPSSGEVAS